jgi:hypothetical protein
LSILQISCLDTFCISHFEEKDDFIRVTKKGLMLDKADFTEKGYMVDENEFPRNPENATSSSGQDKQNVDVIMLDDDSDEDTEKQGEVIPLGELDHLLCLLQPHCHHYLPPCLRPS